MTGPARILILAVAFVLAGFSPARAEVLDPDSVFVVPKVPVEATAESAAAAQRIARDRGRRQAMDILLRRLTGESDWIYLPRLAIGQPAPSGGGGAHGDMADFSGKQAVVLDPGTLAGLEEGFSVYDEKSSRTSYKAQITYRFKPEDVRALLRDSRIPFSESQTRKALILPVLKTENGLYLWESNNPWARAWLARPLVNELTPLVLPSGTVRDIETVSPQQAMALSQGALAEMAERYGVTQILVAVGRLSEAEDGYRFHVQLRNGFIDSKGRVAFDFDAGNETGLYDDADGFGADGVIQAAQSASGELGAVLADAWYRGSRGDFPALAQRAVESIVSKYASAWKAQTLVDHAALREIAITAWFGSIDEWAQIREALEGTPLIRNVVVEALTSDGANIIITAAGDPGQLVLAMKQRNLILWREDMGGWNIATPDTASRVMGRFVPSSLPQNGAYEQRLPGVNDRFDRSVDTGFGSSATADPLGDIEDGLNRMEEDGSGRGTILVPEREESREAPAQEEEGFDSGLY